MRKANVGYNKSKEYVKLLLKNDLIECRKWMQRYITNKKYDEFTSWEARTHRTKYVYRTTEKGWKIVQAWVKVKDSLVPLFLEEIPLFLRTNKTPITKG